MSVQENSLWLQQSSEVHTEPMSLRVQQHCRGGAVQQGESAISNFPFLSDWHTNRIRFQDQTKLWDTNRCACVCRDQRECSAGSHYDQETCSCQAVRGVFRFFILHISFEGVVNLVLENSFSRNMHDPHVWFAFASSIDWLESKIFFSLLDWLIS